MARGTACSGGHGAGMVPLGQTGRWGRSPLGPIAAGLEGEGRAPIDGAARVKPVALEGDWSPLEPFTAAGPIAAGPEPVAAGDELDLVASIIS